MWNRLTGYAQDTGESSDSEVVPVPVPDDVREQLEQQQVLIEQLKTLVRDNENQLSSKEKLLEESNAKLQKFKLQSKAKTAQLNKLKDKPVSEKGAEESDESNNGSSQGSPITSVTDQGTRGKALLLKKQLQESKLKFEQREKEVQESRKNLECIVERLQEELNERTKEIEILKSDEKAETEYKQQQEEFTAKKDVSELYAQIVYKDKKIMDLNDKILECERRMMDLQENLKEKDEVLSTRNKAIQLMSEDLSKRGKIAVDNLDVTRMEMRQMQEVFAEAEARWNQEKITLKEVISSEKEKFTSELNEKEDKLKQAEESMKTLEQARFDLSKRNAELQEKVVRVQENFEKWKESHQKSVEAEINALRINLDKKDMEVTKLKENLEQATSDVDNKILKARAKERSKLKALQKEMDELKKNVIGSSSGENEEKIAELGKHIAELEEEKGSLLLKVMELEEQCKSEEKWTLESSTIEPSSGLSESEIEKLNIAKKDLEERISILIKEKEEASNEIASLNKCNVEIQMKLNETEAYFLKHKNSVGELETKMISYEEHIKMLEANQYTLAEEIVEKEKMVQDLQISLKVVQDDKVALELKIIEFEEQREDDDKAKRLLEKEINRLKQKIEDENVPVLAIEKEKENLEKELATLKTVESQQATRLNEFQNKISQLISETERLQDNHAIASEEMEKLEEEISYKCSEIDNKNQLLQAQSYRLDEMEQALETNEDQTHALERRLEEKDKEIDHLANREIDLENEKAHLEGALNQSQAQISELRETIKRTVESMENLLQQTLQQKESEFVELNATLKRKEVEIETAKLENNKLKREIENALESQSNEGAKIQTKISSLLEQIAELESELSSLQMKSNDQSKQIEFLLAKNNALSDDVQNFKSSLVARIKEATDLQDEKVALLNIIKGKEAGEVNSKNDLEQLHGDLEDLRKALSLANCNLDQLKEEKVSLVDELNSRLTEISSLENKLKDYLLESAVYVDNIDSLQRENQKFSDSISELNEKFNTKVKENETVASEKAEIVRQLEELTLREDKITSINTQLREDLSLAIKSKEDAVQNEIVSLRESNCQLENSCQELQRKLNDKIAEFENVCKLNSEQMSYSESSCQELQKTLSEKQKEIDAFHDRNLELDNKVKELNNKIKSLSNELQSKDEKNSKVLEDINIQNNRDVEVMNFKCNNLIEENNAYKLEMDSSKQFLNFLVQYTVPQFSIINGTLSSINELTSEIKEIPPQFTSASKMGGLAYEEIQSMESDSSERKDSFEIPSNLSQDQARYLEDLHRAFSQVDNLSDFLRQIDNRLKYFKHLTSYLIADNDKLNLEISVLNSEKQSSSTRFTAECEALINKSKVLEDELRNTREYYESSKTAFLDFKTSSEDKEKQLAHELKLIHEANSFLSEEKQALTSEKETLENRISTLETAMENCKREMSFDTAQQHEIQLKMQQSEDRNIELERKLCQIEEKRLKLEAEIERLTIIEAEYHNCCLKIQELERFMRDTLVDHETAQKLIDSLTQDRQEVMDRLKKTVDELESIKLLFSKAQEVENELCEKIELLNKTYISLENERDLLKKENQELHQHTIELKDANKNYETEILNLQQNLIDGEIDFKKLNTSFEEKCLIIENQTQKLNEIETLYSSHEELQTTKTSLENQFEKISLELEASVRDRDNFKSQLEVYQTQCKELQNGADESVKNMSVELENSRTRVVELQTKINEIESHKNQQEENIIALEKSLENLIRETKDLKLLVQQLEEANSEKDNFNENLEQVLRGKTSEFEASLENMSKLQENNEKLENQVSVLSQELGRIQNLTENLEQESRKSEMELEAKNMENFCHVKKIKDLENILAAQTAELDSKNVQIENLNQSRKELELFKDNYDLIKNNLEQSSAFTEKLKEELEFLKSSNQTNVPELERTHYEKRSQDLQTQLEAKLDSQVSVTKKIEELSSDLNKVSSERDQLQSKYSELEAELVQLREEGSIRKEKSYLLGNESSEIATQSGNSDAAVVKENSELKSEIERNKTKMGKMLFKLKQFKEKNDKLTIKVNELSASVVLESTPAEKDEVNHLKMEIEDLKGKNIELANELEESKSFKERFNNLEVLCENLNREIQEVTELKASDQVEAKKENNKLKEELETLAEIKMQLESQARMSKNELDSYLSEKEQLSTEIAFLREQSDMLSNDNETYQSLIENLKQGKQNLEAELIRQKENYSKDTKQLENQVQRLTDSLRKIEIELNEKDNTILKLNFETKQQNENLQKITDDYNKLSIEKRQIEHEKRELGFKLEEASNNIERELLLQEMESLKEHYEQTLQQEKLRNNQRIEKEIFAQNVHHPRDNADLVSEDKINYLEVENSRLASEKEQLRADKSQMQIELESLEGKLKINNQQQRQLLQELNAAKLNLDNQNLIVQNMASENSESKLKKNELEQHCSLLHGEKNRFEKLYHDVCKEKQILEDTMRIKGSNESQGHRNQQLEMELQQAMHTVHQQGIRCEELNMEISRIIEEKTNLQQQLLQNQKSINSRRESKPQEHFVNIEVESAFDEPFRNSKFSVETSQVFELQQRNSRLEETENARQELLSTNASLERDLAREKERRSLVEEELTSAQAWQERMGLNSSKDEYQLLLEEEPLMIPETDFSISRQVLTNAYRVKRWVVGRRNYFTRIIRRSSRIQLVLYFYLFLIHVWLLTCLL